MPGFWSSRLGAAFYTVYFISSTLLQLPWHLISYLSQRRRPNPSWTYRQAVCRFLIRSFLDYAAMVELQQPMSLNPGKEAVRFVLIPPAVSHIYADILCCDSSIKPAGIGAI